MPSRDLTVGILHLAPDVGDLAGNRALIERATVTAADHGCNWVVSGELIEPGYDFVPHLGTDWIEPRPDAWLSSYAALLAELGVVGFVNVPDRDPTTGRLHSALIAIGNDGVIAGRHYKIAVIPGSESWSSPGDDAVPVTVDGLSVGLLVCADAHPPGIADRFAERGADVFVSAAAWTPGHHGPDGEWESISERTGCPVIVANRGGFDGDRGCGRAESVVCVDGRRDVQETSARSIVVVVHVSLGNEPFAMLNHLVEIGAPATGLGR